MDSNTDRFSQVGPPSLEHDPHHVAYQATSRQETSRVHEGHQHSDPVQDFQQTSQPLIKPGPQDRLALRFLYSTPQNKHQYSGPVQHFQHNSQPMIEPGPQDRPALRFLHIVPQNEQNPSPNEMPQKIHPGCRSLCGGMPIQDITESTNGHFYNHQPRHPREVDQKGPPAIPGRLLEQTYTSCNSSPDGLSNGNPVNEKPCPQLKHGTTPPTTPRGFYGSVGGSHHRRPRKALRTATPCTSCRSSKVKCNGHHSRCGKYRKKNIDYKEAPQHTIKKTIALRAKVEVRPGNIEKLLQQMYANSGEILTTPQQQNTQISSRTEPVQQSESLNGGNEEEYIGSPPKHEHPVWSGRKTAASSIFSRDLVPNIVGNVVNDDETAGTISRLSNLYMKNVNKLYPMLTPTQLECLMQDFIEAKSLSNTTSLRNYIESDGFKFRRSGPERLQSPLKRALVLLILAHGKTYDDDLSTECEGSLSRSTVFQNGYPTPKYIEKPWTGASLDEHSSYETRITGDMSGLEYFTAATDIMARHTGDRLCHVQVYLLASIYHGQLAQDTQRHNCLLDAARGLQIQLKRTLKQFPSITWDFTFICLFWTQRLLEGELVAERALPESVLRIWEPTVPLPVAYALKIQLEFRKHVGDINTELYQPEQIHEPALDDEAALSNLYTTVESLYYRLGEIYRPHQVGVNDPNPKLTTRLNAKAFASMALAFRPCLMTVLNRDDPAAKISKLVLNCANRCIWLLEYSIQSSNLIADDPFITHVQWHNVMTLLAAFSDVAVKDFIDHDLLRDLVSRTRDSLLAWPSLAFEQNNVETMENGALKVGLYQQQVPIWPPLLQVSTWPHLLQEQDPTWLHLLQQQDPTWYPTWSPLLQQQSLLQQQDLTRYPTWPPLPQQQFLLPTASSNIVTEDTEPWGANIFEVQFDAAL